MPMPSAAPTAPPHIERNIDAVANLERLALEQRSWSDRLGDAIANFLGRISFVVVHVAWFSTWIVLNRPGARHPFDPYPHSLLTLVVSLEAILLSTFVLMSQNRMMKAAARRTQLDLQINLLAESEMTMVLKTLHAITTHLGIVPVASERELRDLLQDTPIEAVARVIEEKLQPSADPAATTK